MARNLPIYPSRKNIADLWILFSVQSLSDSECLILKRENVNALHIKDE
jgi:hypothetical protein